MSASAVFRTPAKSIDWNRINTTHPFQLLGELLWDQTASACCVGPVSANDADQFGLLYTWEVVADNARDFAPYSGLNLSEVRSAIEQADRVFQAACVPLAPGGVVRDRGLPRTMDPSWGTAAEEMHRLAKYTRESFEAYKASGRIHQSRREVNARLSKLTVDQFRQKLAANAAACGLKLVAMERNGVLLPEALVADELRESDASKYLVITLEGGPFADSVPLLPKPHTINDTSPPIAMPATPADGPERPGHFRFRGREFHQFGDLQWKLLRVIWRHAEGRVDVVVPLDVIFKEVYQGELRKQKRNTLMALKNNTNTTLLREGFSLSIQHSKPLSGEGFAFRHLTA